MKTISLIRKCLATESKFIPLKYPVHRHLLKSPLKLLGFLLETSWICTGDLKDIFQKVHETWMDTLVWLVNPTTENDSIYSPWPDFSLEVRAGNHTRIFGGNWLSRATARGVPSEGRRQHHLPVPPLLCGRQSAQPLGHLLRVCKLSQPPAGQGLEELELLIVVVCSVRVRCVYF